MRMAIETNTALDKWSLSNGPVTFRDGFKFTEISFLAWQVQTASPVEPTKVNDFKWVHVEPVQTCNRYVLPPDESQSNVLPYAFPCST